MFLVSEAWSRNLTRIDDRPERDILQDDQATAPPRLFTVTCWSPALFQVQTSVHFYALANREPHPPLQHLFSPDFGRISSEDVAGTDEMFRESELPFVRDFVEKKLGWAVTITAYYTPIARPQLFNTAARIVSCASMAYGPHWGQLRFVTDGLNNPRFELCAFWAHDHELPTASTNPSVLSAITAGLQSKSN